MPTERFSSNDQIYAAELNSSSSPTTLHLFSYHGAKLERAKASFITGDQLKREFLSANGTMAKLSAETVIRINRITEALTESREIVVDQRSCRVAGMAYLRIVDELSDQGLASEEVMDFYYRCLRINTKVTTFIYELRKKTGARRAIADSLMGERSKAFSFTTTVINQEAEASPAWFKGNKNAWTEFIWMHGIFGTYLYPELIDKDRISIDLEDEERYPNFTLEHALPEWFTGRRDTLPDRKMVETELEEDERESARTTAQLIKMTGDKDYLARVVREKWQRAVPRFEDRRRKLLGAVTSFADFVIFLNSTETMREYTMDLASASMMTVDQMGRTAIDADRSRVRTLNKVAELDSVVLSQEAIALWLETQLREGEIITSAQNVLDQRLAKVFYAVLDQTDQSGTSAGELLSILRESNKKAFKTLNYEVLPLLTLMSADEKAYIGELIQIYQGGHIEPLIWEIAEVLSLKLRGSLLSGQALTVVNRIKEFSARWIKNHWKWAYTQLDKVMSINSSQVTTSIVQQEVSEKSSVESSVTQAYTEELKEIEELITNIQRGNLNDWHLYYTFNRRTNDPSLVEIGGITDEEREVNFKQFVARNSLSCSIKPESVIRAFEWLVAVPQHIENIRMRKEIDGEVFKKIKRGSVRILYTLDSDKKNIIFFIHQKKAQSYGF